MSVVLVSTDDSRYTVEKDIGMRINVVKYRVELAKDMEEILVPKVSGDVLGMLQYCKEHRSDPLVPDNGFPLVPSPTPLPSPFSEWDTKWIRELEQNMLFELILAAHYSKMKPLVELGCTVVADLVKGKTPQEVRDLFRVPEPKTQSACNT
ncbi:probable negative regulator sulfur controller-3 [Serendipita indica DSM 11827]|uniref:E3 ubiquitin ligase complex SCF subunit n=1 Tax=Serendipita indica (strain DSM 11827) TaxID=1109443 RepID=G4TEB5_SERID|nr:probable negative regulator sulfur controller-3 [Serendipita indica DSM 11827]